MDHAIDPDSRSICVACSCGCHHSCGCHRTHHILMIEKKYGFSFSCRLGWEGGFISGFRFYPHKIGTSLRALRALAKFLISYQIKSSAGNNNALGHVLSINKCPMSRFSRFGLSDYRICHVTFGVWERMFWDV